MDIRCTSISPSSLITRQLNYVSDLYDIVIKNDFEMKNPVHCLKANFRKCDMKIRLLFF